MPTIVRGAVLRMEVPSLEMGQTGFVDAIGAYDRLSPAMKKRIENLEIVYLFDPDFARGQYGFPADIRALPREGPGKGSTYDCPPVVHPWSSRRRRPGARS